MARISRRKRYYPIIAMLFLLVSCGSQMPPVPQGEDRPQQTDAKGGPNEDTANSPVPTAPEPEKSVDEAERLEQLKALGYM